MPETRRVVALIGVIVLLFVADLLVAFLWYQPIKNQIQTTVCDVTECVSYGDLTNCFDNTSGYDCQNTRAVLTTLQTKDNHVRSQLLKLGRQYTDYCTFHNNQIQECYYMLGDLESVYDTYPSRTIEGPAIVLTLITIIAVLVLCYLACTWS